jgi:hypothetical protein
LAGRLAHEWGRAGMTGMASRRLTVSRRSMLGARH